MSSWTLITGASSGIGKEFARLLASQGKNLIITARREDRLQQIQSELQSKTGVQVEVIPCDLATPSGPQQLYDAVKARQLEVTTLINNAGFGVYENFISADRTRLDQMMQLNMVALTDLTHLFAQDMKARQNGEILLVASIAGLQGLPHYAVYAATKAYVISFGDAIHQELKRDGIRVSTLSPGLTQTEFFEQSGFERTDAMSYITMSAESVAAIGLKGLERGKRHVVPGALNRITVCLMRIMPKFVIRFATSRAMEAR